VTPIVIEELKQKLKEMDLFIKKYHHLMQDFFSQHEKTYDLFKHTMNEEEYKKLYLKIKRHKAKREYFLNILINEKRTIKEKNTFFNFKITDKFFSQTVFNLFEKEFDLTLLTEIDEKQCSIQTKKVILWVLKNIVHNTKSKKSIYYRNFLTSSKEDRKKTFIEKFYYTFVNPFDDCPVTINEFLALPTKERKSIFKKNYQELDKELKTNVSYYEEDNVVMELVTKNLRKKIKFRNYCRRNKKNKRKV